MKKINLDHIPDGEIGNWKIETYEVHANCPRRFFGGGRVVPAGIYRRLIRKDTNETVMSNTPDEINDHAQFFEAAHGEVLITGLGLGMCLTEVLKKPEVTGVTVVELATEVIQLVAPYFNDERLQIVNASAFDFIPPKGKKYDVAWHDIWTFIEPDNLPQMDFLRAKYRPYCKRQMFWCQRQCKRMAIREEREAAMYLPYSNCHD